MVRQFGTMALWAILQGWGGKFKMTTPFPLARLGCFSLW